MMMFVCFQIKYPMTKPYFFWNITGAYFTLISDSIVKFVCVRCMVSLEIPKLYSADQQVEM